MRKIVIIILALVVALAALPVTFACYNGGWGNWNWFWQPNHTVYCCPEYCNVVFTSTSASDNDETSSWEPKDVAQTNSSITCCGKTLTITVENAYPGYVGTIDFCVTNTGSMAATITGITPNYPDPLYLQILPTGEVQEGTVIKHCETKCGQILIYGVPQREDAQNRTFTFDITIDYQCTCVPEDCDTAFAYKCGDCGGDDCATCFSEWGFERWGWTNGPLCPGCHRLPIYAGADHCNPLNGKHVGYLTVYYNGSTAFVTYNMFYGYKMTGTHLFAGNEPLPRKNGDGDYTVSPGQYPYHDGDATLVTDTKVVYVIPVSGPIYIIAHADVCR
jgi:hypothetical protein